jgi:hypothetical protein
MITLLLLGLVVGAAYGLYANRNALAVTPFELRIGKRVWFIGNRGINS